MATADQHSALCPDCGAPLALALRLPAERLPPGVLERGDGLLCWVCGALWVDEGPGIRRPTAEELRRAQEAPALWKRIRRLQRAVGRDERDDDGV